MNYSEQNSNISLIRYKRSFLITYPFCRKYLSYSDLVPNVRVFNNIFHFIIIIESIYNDYFINSLIPGNIGYPKIIDEAVNIKKKLLRFMDFDYDRLFPGDDHDNDYDKSRIFIIAIDKSDLSVSYLYNTYPDEPIKDSFFTIYSRESGKANTCFLQADLNTYEILRLNDLYGMLDIPYRNILIKIDESGSASSSVINHVFLRDILFRCDNCRNREEFSRRLIFSDQSFYERVRSIYHKL